MSAAMPSWTLIGKVATFVVAWLAYSAAAAIVELYWPGVYEFIVDGAATYWLLWLLVLRRRTP